MCCVSRNDELCVRLEGRGKVTWPCRLRCNISHRADSIESKLSISTYSDFHVIPTKVRLKCPKKKQMEKPEASIQIFRKRNVSSSTQFAQNHKRAYGDGDGTITHVIRAFQSLFQKINSNIKLHNSIACYWFPPWQWAHNIFNFIVS